MDSKRVVELVVISDVHLGTSGCQAAELLKYLKTIKPKTLILNGDIVDYIVDCYLCIGAKHITE